jgi:hypothetical protein
MSESKADPSEDWVLVTRREVENVGDLAEIANGRKLKRS